MTPLGSTERQRLFFVSILARPTEKADAFGEFGGAYVNCWVDADLESEAVTLAEEAIRESQWQPITIEQVSVVTRENYEDDDDGLEYFEQALIDGMIVVFHPWPNKPRAEDEVH